jgi:hypothetical protein
LISGAPLEFVISPSQRRVEDVAKFNTTTTKVSVSSPVQAEHTPSGRTYNQAPGHARDAKSELFLLAVANLVGQPTFYEKANERDNRFGELVRTVADEDPDWMAGFLLWLRNEANMRSAPLVAALEAAKAMVAAGKPGARALVNAVLQRADEPGEALAYWTSRYGRAIPKPVKRGIADAMIRLGTEFNYVKWGTSEARGFRFADILNLTHPGDRRGSRQRIRAPWQHDLFSYAVAKRYRDVELPASLELLTRRQALMGLPVNERRSVLEDPQTLKRAGITWEALAGWLQGPMDAAAWEAIIPSMGYMALLRNLRNFDQAGVSDSVAEQVAARLADPAQVARSRQFPFRFYAAYKNVSSLRWAYPLEKALAASLANVPELAGRTLVLVDQSPSMFPGYGFSTPNRSDITLADQAKLFGSALALRADDATLVGYGSGNYRVPFSKGDAVLRTMEKFHMNDGTDTPRAVVDHYDGHHRVVIVTDEQTSYSRTGRTVDGAVPHHVPVYTWNVAGYRHGHTPSGTGQRHTFGGLTDQAFQMIPLLEAGRNANWPWAR